MKVETTHEQLLFSVVRLETDKQIGTGFFFSREEDGRTIPFLVTNKHVVADAETYEFFLHLGGPEGPRLGDVVPVKITPEGEKFEFAGHPDKDVDIAVLPVAGVLNARSDLFYRRIGQEMVPSGDAIRELTSFEDVVFPGFPDGLFDSTNFLPITRRGVTATPVSADFEGCPAFLIDASAFPGSSGSPVLIVNQGAYYARTGTAIGRRGMLLGVLSASYFRRSKGVVEYVDAASEPEFSAEEMLDLGTVFKTRCVDEAIDYALSLRDGPTP